MTVDRSPREAVDASETVLRPTVLGDGAAVYDLACDSGALDHNSPYLYLMWCDRFGSTSVLAEIGGEPAGFVCAFRPPETPDVLFVWQVAVSSESRGRRLAARMIDHLLERDPDVRYVEATVTPSNIPSASLFRSVARNHDCACEERPYLEASDFPKDGHEAETLFRIGPIERS